MDGMTQEHAIRIGGAALDRLMPMHVCLSIDGVIKSAGPTLTKIFVDEPLTGANFFDRFEIQRPGRTTNMDDLRGCLGVRLRVMPRLKDAQTLRGVAMPLPNAEGMVINLSFGIGVIEAVSKYQLTEADFAATELAMELLYLVEAKTTVMEELRRLNLRLQGARDAAQEQALTDTLTGLRNRRALDAVLDQAISAGETFALMHIDLDFFKAVNDTLGHAAGDFVLREVAETLSRETRPSDTVARVGGDEFVLVFSMLTDRAALVKIAERIITKLSEPLEFEGNECRISASIGISLSTDYALPDPDRMQSDADHALYASKKAGRGQARVFAG